MKLKENEIVRVQDSQLTVRDLLVFILSSVPPKDRPKVKVYSEECELIGNPVGIHYIPDEHALVILNEDDIDGVIEAHKKREKRRLRLEKKS